MLTGLEVHEDHLHEGGLSEENSSEDDHHHAKEGMFCASSGYFLSHVMEP
jgi:hypothetical protein